MNAYGFAVDSYDFVAPRQLAFGWGRRSQIGELVRPLGRRAWIVCGAAALIERGVIDTLRRHLSDAGVESRLLTLIEHEPLVEDVDRTSEQLRAEGVAPGDLLLAVGGGSAIDLAKAVAAMAVNDDSPTVADYLEYVGRNLTLRVAPLPVVAMPTTAGTGAEATRNAVISGRNPPLKRSLRDWRLMPQLVLVDPELTVTLPTRATVACGLDAITQLIESYISRKKKPIAQALVRQGLPMALWALPRVVERPDDRPAREAMAHAALLSGLALANSGLGMAHGVAAALGVHCGVAHGEACAVMLPAALRTNASVCRPMLAELWRTIAPFDEQAEPFPGPDSAHAPDLFAAEYDAQTPNKGDSLGSAEQKSGVPLRDDRRSELHTAREAADAERFIACIEWLCDRVQAPRRLAQLGVQPEQLPLLVRDSRGSSMSGNPRELSDEELHALLESML